MVSADALDVAALREAMGGLQRLFPITCAPPITWGRAQLHLGKNHTLEAVKLSKSGKVVVHRILGHPKVPTDVREAAVFLGILIWKAHEAQEALPGHVCDHPDLSAWVDRQMALLPASEFLGMWLSKFNRWVTAL